MKRIRCETCLRWSHLDCTFLSSSLKSVVGKSYFCTVKCELQSLPFCSVKNEDLDIFMKQKRRHRDCKIVPQHQRISKFREENYFKKKSKVDFLPQCEYIETNNINNEFMNHTGKPGSLNIFHCNLRSANKNLKRVEELFSKCTRMPDVIGISETKHKNVTDALTLGGYKFEGCPTQTEAGGVGIYIHDDFSYEIRNDLSLKTDYCEDKWIQMNLREAKSAQNNSKTKGKKLVIGIIYRHPEYSYENFCDQLCDTIEKLNQNRTDFVIMGDMNVNLLKYNVANNVTNYLQSIRSAGCQSFIDIPTRVCVKTNRTEISCLDHLYSNVLPNLVKTHIIRSGISDHYATLAKVDCEINIKPENYNIMKRKTKLTAEQIVNFNTDLQIALSNGDAHYDVACPNASTAHLIKTYHALTDKYMPLRKLSRKERKFHQKPWYTKGIKISVITRDKLHRKSLRTKRITDVKKYKKYRNLLSRIIKISKDFYDAEIIEKYEDDKRRVWQQINKMTNRKSHKKISVDLLIDAKGNELRDKKEIANNLNDHFNTIGSKMASKFENSARKDPLRHITRSPLCTMYFLFATNDEISKLISEIEAKKATGPDGISAYLVKISLEVLAPKLTMIFNKCIKESTFPNLLKIAEIIPLHKGGEKTNSTNYRPISLLPIFGKLFEKVIANRITKFFDKNNVITPHQYGFRRNHSTELAVTEIHNKLLRNMDEGKHTCTIFLDLAKAFDSVDHKILLGKLEKYGIRGGTLKLLESYLSGRQHYVKLDNTKSSSRLLEIGVPQGSVLGPLLFLVFINDLPNCCNLDVTLFADDTSLSLASKNLSLLKKQMNKELKNVYNWLVDNKLTLNISKSKYMIISKTKKIFESDFQIKLNGKKLERCSEYKYLGVYIDEKINWKKHVQYICDKLSKVCGYFAKLRYCAGPKTIKMIYNALVFSHLKYCNIAWGSASPTILTPLTTLLNRIVKTIAFAPFQATNVVELFERLEIHNINQINTLEIGKFMFKYKNDMLPERFEGYFQLSGTTHDHNLRSVANKKFTQPKVNGLYGLKMIHNTGAKLWNDLPIEIKNQKTIKAFTNLFKFYVLEI